MNKIIYSLAVIFIIHFTLITENSFSQWVQMSNGIGDADVRAMVISGNNIFAATWVNNGVLLSTNNGNNWIQTGLNNTNLYSLGVYENNIIAGTNGQGTWFTTNSGQNWLYRGLDLAVFCFAIYGNNILAGTGPYGIWKSSDNGQNWTQTAFNYGTVFSIAISGNNIFAGTDFGGIYLSTNEGQNWIQTSLNNGIIDAIAINSNYVFAGKRGEGLWLSTNNGQNWDQIGLIGQSVSSITIIGPNIFAGTTGNGGIWLSTNFGQNWVQKNEGFNAGFLDVRTVKILMNYIYTGNLGNGVWRRPLTELIIPTVPSLITPVNNSIGQSLSLNLVWTKTQLSTKYRLLLAADSMFTNVVVNDSLLSDSIKNISNLNTLTNYFWKVSAGNTAGWSSYSPVYKFRTIGSPTQVNLFAPSNNSVNQPVNITLRWYRALDQVLKPKMVSNYWIEYSPDSAFVTGVIKDSSLTDTLKILSGISTLTKYYWRVKAKNSAGWGLFSNIWNFTTVPPVPLVPVLISPPNNSIDVPPNVLLDWTAVQYASGYRVQISNDSTFNTIVYDTNSVITDSLRIRYGILNSNSKFYWKVNAFNISGSGVWSTTWSFTVNLTFLTQVNIEVPNKFTLHQNYPNPFNPSTKIRFDVPNSDVIKLVVYDFLGREVSTPVNQQLKPGIYEVEFNDIRLSSGIYFYIMYLDGAIFETKKMILIK